MSEPEIERRFIIIPNRDTLPLARKIIIEQCYLSSDDLSDSHIRVRITDGRHGSMTSKVGTGVERRESTVTLGYKEARWLMDRARHKIKKIRHLLPDPKHGGQWMIDVYEGRYAGLVLAERALKHRDEPVELPRSIGTMVKEVTTSLTNLHLALACTELDENAKPGEPQLPERLPCIVLTGGPGAGKSTLTKRIMGQFPGRVHCVPETASILISQAQVKPYGGDARKAVNFQVATARIQQQFERASHFEARFGGAKLLVLDRGIMDGAAYTPGGMDRFEQLFGTSRDAVYSRYDTVIFLEMPDEATYEQIMRENPARFEQYAAGREVAERLREVWQDHPHFVCVPHEHGLGGYAKKCFVALQLIQEKLERM